MYLLYHVYQCMYMYMCIINFSLGPTSNGSDGEGSNGGLWWLDKEKDKLSQYSLLLLQSEMTSTM